MQGVPRAASWTSHKFTNEDIDKLQDYFTRVLELPLSIMEESRRRQWGNRSLFVRSLGRKVPADWVAREFKLKLRFDKESAVFSLAENHLIFLVQK